MLKLCSKHRPRTPTTSADLRPKRRGMARALRVGLRSGLVGLCVLLADPEGRADSVTLRPVADTSIFESNPENNLGGSAALPVGTINRGLKSRLLLRFDLAGAVPPGATIVDATLVVKVVNAGGVHSNFRFHRLLVNWGEGVKTGTTGAAAGPSEATWNERSGSLSTWSAPGAAAPADYVAVPSFTLPLRGLGQYTLSLGPETGMVSDIQSWLANPASNYGWIVLSDQEATPQTSKRLASREDAEGSPTLLITFSKPVPPVLPRFKSILPENAGSGVNLLIQAPAGATYELQYVDRLPASAWAVLTNFTAKLVDVEFTMTDTPSPLSSRFYRLRQSALVD